jgi:hypothetical protein
MKAKDLRINNLVNAVMTNEVYSIDLWALNVIEEGNYQNSHNTKTKVFKPIPLTEEWLLKFGFEKVIYESDETGYGTDYELDIKGVGLISYSDDFSCALFGSKESSKDELGFLPNWDNCKHVHSLQNLYFALTGEELTLNN